MAPGLAGVAVLEKTFGNLGRAAGIVKLPIGEKSSVGSDLGTVELKLQSTGETDPEMGFSGFTRRVTWDRRPDDGIALILITESPKQIIELVIHLGNPG